MSQTVVFYAQFTSGGAPKTGLSATIDVTSINRSNSAVAGVVTAGAMTEIVTPNAHGLYFYVLAGVDLTTFDYIGACISNGSVDQTVVPALWSQAPAALTPTGLAQVLIESGIAASANLTNDSGAQLTAITLPQAVAAILSAAAGLVSGLTTSTSPAVLKPAGLPAGNTRIAATVDTNGNRSGISLVVPN